LVGGFVAIEAIALGGEEINCFFELVRHIWLTQSLERLRSSDVDVCAFGYPYKVTPCAAEAQHRSVPLLRKKEHRLMVEMRW
jgi:hypothetical protein